MRLTVLALIALSAAFPSHAFATATCTVFLKRPSKPKPIARTLDHLIEELDPKLRRYARSTERSDWEDLAQIALMRIVDVFERRGFPPGNPIGYYYTVGKSAITDKIREDRAARRGGRVHTFSLTSAEGEEITPHLSDRGRGQPHLGLEARLDVQGLSKKLLGLSHSEYNLLRLVFEYGLSTHDTGFILGIPSGTVKSRSFYAREKLELMPKVEVDGKEISIETPFTESRAPYLNRLFIYFVDHRRKYSQGIWTLDPLWRAEDIELAFSLLTATQQAVIRTQLANNFDTEKTQEQLQLTRDAVNDTIRKGFDSIEAKLRDPTTLFEQAILRKDPIETTKILIKQLRLSRQGRPLSYGLTEADLDFVRAAIPNLPTRLEIRTIGEQLWLEGRKAHEVAKSIGVTTKAVHTRTQSNVIPALAELLAEAPIQFRLESFQMEPSENITAAQLRYLIQLAIARENKQQVNPDVSRKTLNVVMSLISELRPRDRQILEVYFGKGITLDAASQEVGIQPEHSTAGFRLSQAEAQILSEVNKEHSPDTSKEYDPLVRYLARSFSTSVTYQNQVPVSIDPERAWAALEFLTPLEQRVILIQCFRPHATRDELAEHLGTYQKNINTQKQSALGKILDYLERR